MTDSLIQNQVADISTPKVSETGTKMLAQDEVNYIVTKAKERAYEEGKREALAAVQQQPQAAAPVISDEIIAQKVDERVKAMMNNHVGEQIASNFYKNVSEGRQKYADYDDVASTINWEATRGLIPMANAMTNAKDVIYHLGKEPAKFNQINMALQSGQPKVAERLMKSFAESIVENEKALEKAKKQPQAAQPLSQLKPSVIGTGGGNSLVGLSYDEICAAVNSRGRK